MKPPSTWPPPVTLVGRKVMRIKLGRAGVDGQGRMVQVPDADPEAGMDLFEVVDPVAPYVAMRNPPKQEPGAWADLEPDYLARDGEGALVFIQGHGDVRARLSSLGISKSRWEALAPPRRKQVIAAIRALTFAEMTVPAMIKHRQATVGASARKFLAKLMRLVAKETQAPRGIRSEKQRARGFSVAKQMLPVLTPMLKTVKKEGLSLRRDTFTDPAWRAEKAAQVNAALVGQRLSAPCTADDIEKLRAADAGKVALSIASRAGKISGDLLRYDELRDRSKRRISKKKVLK